MIDSKIKAAALKILGVKTMSELDFDGGEDFTLQAVKSPEIYAGCRYYEDGFPFCCGIAVVGGFNSGPRTEQEKAVFALSIEKLTHKQIVATTIPKQTGAISMLEFAGFKPVSVSAGQEGNITLWVLVTRPPSTPVARKPVRRGR